MSKYGVTEYGFKKKTLDQLIDDLQSRAKTLFGDDVNLTDSSPLGKFIKLNALEMSYIWNMAEDVYNSVFLNTSEDLSLDNFVSFLGLTRKKAESSTGTAIFSGDENTEITEGFQIETESNTPIVFTTTESGIIDSSGSIELAIESVEKGDYTNVAANTITNITNPISGLDSVTNPEPTEGGQDRESDYELKNRYKNSLSAPGSSTLASIRASVLAVSGVRACVVEENDTFEIDSNGRKPKSFEVIVLGGDSADIANAIFDKKPAGIQSEGGITVEIEDDSGNTQLVNFSRATEVDIYAEVTLFIDSSKFPDDGETEVRDEIIGYIGGIDSSNDTVLGLSLGENVIYNEIINAVMSVPGVDDCEITIGKSAGTTAAGNILIEHDEVATISLDDIVVS